ncbi:MAG TPA: peptidoglycan bridge formation glycyltransferase FemA/FemB family protein [Candidatus Limnocylindrales bacterium]|nr:peptidoglycan bridge formation glycyltransferase FemA/FemB family protein [Candidatus Limnocylindrales bacterium]
MKTSAGEALGPQDWDRALLRQPAPSLLQSWRWGELQARFGWRVDRIAFDGGGSGVCSLQRADGLWPRSTIAYVPRGPAIAPSAAAEVLAELEARARRARDMVLRIEPQVPAGDPMTQALTRRRFQPGEPVQPHATRLLDLTPEPEALRAAFKSKTRYNLSLAERKGVVVRATRDVDTFARLAEATARRQGIALPAAPYYRAALDIFEPDDGVRLYLASHDGRTLAGIMVFRFGDTAYYLFGGSTDEGREVMPNYLLHWTAMLDYRALGCRVYDWWGIPEEPAPDHPWFGLYRFKTGFGGTTVRYAGLYERVLRPGRWGWDRRLRKLKQRVRGPILR